MYVCLCKAVTERTVRSLIRGGVSTREEVGRRCGAGTDCGGCRGAIDDMLEDELEARGCSAACAAAHGSHGSNGAPVFAAASPVTSAA